MTHCSSQVCVVYCDVYMICILCHTYKEYMLPYNLLICYTICIGMGVRVLLHRGDEAPITAGHFGVVHPEVCMHVVCLCLCITMFDI